MTTARCWPSTPPWKGFRMDTKNKALCVLGKKQTKNRPSDSQMFSGEDFYASKFLHLFIPREALMSWINVFLASPSAAFLCLLIFGPYTFNFLVKFVSPSSSTTRISLANTQTMLEQAAFSSCGPSSPSVNAPWGPRAVLPLRSYMGDHPSDKKSQGRPPTTSWPRDVLTPPGPGKVFCHIAWETLERTSVPLGSWVPPYQPGDKVWVKDGKKRTTSASLDMSSHGRPGTPYCYASYRRHPLDPPHQSQEGSGFLWWGHLESSLGPQKSPQGLVPKTTALTHKGRRALLESL